MIVVADTSPLNYLILTTYDLLLPQLFGSILVPEAVVAEMSDSKAPEPVRKWIQRPPDWLQVQRVSALATTIGTLGRGEVEGILLAESLKADLILIDDAAARDEAERRRLRVTGTLGVLRLAAARGLVDIAEAIARLRVTNFYIAPHLLDDILRGASE